MKKILVYGYGNPGRQDDGLGPAFVEILEKNPLSTNGYQIDTDSNYQLNVEDALEISEYDIVIFVDASIEENVASFFFSPIESADAEVKYTLHAASPAYILQLCQQMYNKFPQTWLMHIKGEQWEFKEGLSDEAKKNLQKAFQHFADWLMTQKD